MASDFTKKFQKMLVKSLNKSGIKPTKEYPLIVEEKPALLVPVDIAIDSDDKKKLILIEIESHRQDPSNNVAKVIYWLRKKKLSKSVILVQLFSPFYRDHPTKKAVSLELGKVLTELTTALYKPVDFASKHSDEKFNKIYKYPNDHSEEISQLAKQTAIALITLLSLSSQ